MRIEDIIELERFCETQLEKMTKIMNDVMDMSSDTRNKSVSWAEELDTVATDVWKSRTRLNKFRMYLKTLLP